MESLNLQTLFHSRHHHHSFPNNNNSNNRPRFSYLLVYPQRRKPTSIHIFPQAAIRRIETTYYCCLHSPSTSSSNTSNYKSDTTSDSDANFSVPSEKGFIRNAAWIGFGTLTSKILGLLREVIFAAVFGVGPVATAFKYASVLPGFTAALIGGVNGPIHITMVTTLSKLSKERRRKLFQHSNCIMFLVGGALGALVFVSAEFIIHIYAPGLWILAEGQITREIAIAQEFCKRLFSAVMSTVVFILRTMTPCIVLAGPVGLGFGYMSAEGNNLLPSFSPAFSSMFIMASCVMYSCFGNSNAFLYLGGASVACGASLGAFLQWIMQVMVLGRRQYDMVPGSWITIFEDKDIHEFFSLLLPATISSSLAQVASFTDLCLASLIPGAAAALSYAYLLAMAPVGLLSSVVILPLLPTFSRLSKTESWSALVVNLKRATLVCMVVLLPILSLMCVLAEPIIRFLFERYVFDSAATALVSSLFLFYSLGSPFYIVRELLVVVFYSLGDAQKPFLVSVGAIALNAILDCLFVSNFGAQGLALSTSFTTALSVLVLLNLLRKKLPGVVDYAALVYPFLLLSFCCISCGFTSSFTYKLMRGRFSSVFIIRIQEFISIALASTTGMIGFFFPVMLLHLSGFELVRDLSRILMNRG